jgi:hypothetical protein
MLKVFGRYPKYLRLYGEINRSVLAQTFFDRIFKSAVERHT